MATLTYTAHTTPAWRTSQKERPRASLWWRSTSAYADDMANPAYISSNSHEIPLVPLNEYKLKFSDQNDKNWSLMLKIKNGYSFGNITNCTKTIKACGSKIQLQYNIVDLMNTLIWLNRDMRTISDVFLIYNLMCQIYSLNCPRPSSVKQMSHASRLHLVDTKYSGDPHNSNPG